MNRNDRTNGASGAGAVPPGTDLELTLDARPERQLIRPHGSFRHVDFAIRVGAPPSRAAVDRPPVTLALVLDRSGSMAGGKLETAKQAALVLLDRLDDRDRVAVVVYDDQIDVVQELAPISASLKTRLRQILRGVQARASTALHEGWLTGCRAIAGDDASESHGLARCFLLTDGLANVGLTEPEQIATEVADVRRHAGIGTSTFGIGVDYDERLLAPMAAAGGGQFHHLRDLGEIANTFVGELGGMLSVAASQVRLELETDAGVAAQVVTPFWTEPHPSGRAWTVTIGDLMPGEERHVIVQFRFPSSHSRRVVVRGRLIWLSEGRSRSSPWSEVAFTYASHAACDAEARDPAVMHWVGLHHADLARREATECNRRGDLRGARERLGRVARRIAKYADGDPALLEAVEELKAFGAEVAEAPLSAMAIKEAWEGTYRRARGQRDHR